VLFHLYDIILLAGGTAAESEALCMANECREVVRVYCVDDVEEELSIWAIGRGLLLREELAQIWYVRLDYESENKIHTRHTYIISALYI